MKPMRWSLLTVGPLRLLLLALQFLRVMRTVKLLTLMPWFIERKANMRENMALDGTTAITGFQL